MPTKGTLLQSILLALQIHIRKLREFKDLCEGDTKKKLKKSRIFFSALFFKNRPIKYYSVNQISCAV
jgi:hypothetical protein